MRNLSKNFRKIHYTDPTSFYDVVMDGVIVPEMIKKAQHSELNLPLKQHEKSEVIYLDAKSLAMNPFLVTEELCENLKSFSGQIIIQTAFHHPLECNEETFKAVNKLADAGCMLVNRSILFEAFNDDLETIKKLNHLLLMMRVRPYSLQIQENQKEIAVKILDGLRGWTSGLAVPHLLCLSADGNITHLLPHYLQEKNSQGYVFRNYKNDSYDYRDR